MYDRTSPNDRELLENVFDSLDRLFDRECQVIDLCVLLRATELAIRAEKLPFSLSQYHLELAAIVRSGASSEAQREKALDATNSLREKMNEFMYLKDASEIK